MGKESPSNIMNLVCLLKLIGPGQLALYNLLKSYSLLDSEVGYCQGLSFIAGVLLLHLDESEAYCMLRYLMLDLGLRRQYLPDMAALQTQLYQMARLLRDLHRDLYQHLEENDVNPTLYAAPWFLTLFASQFPLGFVVRVFGKYLERYTPYLITDWWVFQVAVNHTLMPFIINTHHICLNRCSLPFSDIFIDSRYLFCYFKSMIKLRNGHKFYQI